MKCILCPSTVDEAGKMVSEDGTEVTVEGAVEDQEVEKDEDGQEVIKVYIFKADSGEDDMGEDQSLCLLLLLKNKKKTFVSCCAIMEE